MVSREGKEMNHIELLIGFTLGFSFAIALIARVSIRPGAKKALKKVGVIKEYKAKVPRKENLLEI